MKRMKAKTKRGVTLIAVALACLTIGAIFGNAFDLHKPNEDNLWQEMSFNATDGVILDGADGVTVKLTEDNELKVNGYAETAQEVLVGSYTLEANTSYVFDSSLNDGSNKTVYMVVKANGSVIAKSYTGPVVISARTTDTQISVYLMIAEDVNVSTTLRPILCEGAVIDDLVSFY